MSPRAARELRAALQEIAQDNVQAARAMNDAVQLTCRRLGNNPALGASRPYVSRRFRVWPLTRWRYLLIYDGDSNPVQILRIVHMARDLPRVLSDLRAP